MMYKPGRILQEFYFEPTDDKIIVAEPNYVTVIFGHATTTLAENTAESRWVYERFADIKRIIPNGHLKVLIDFTTIDSSEYNSDESNTLYRQMLHDDQIDRVAIFGLHSGWSLLISLIAIFAPHKLKTFDTAAEAKAWLES